MRVTVFSPDDLPMVKEGPGGRRRFLDDVFVAMALKYDACAPRARSNREAAQHVAEAGRRAPQTTRPRLTLDVWDSKLADVGDRFGHARAVLVARLSPLVVEAYEQLADRPTSIELRYEPAVASTRPRCRVRRQRVRTMCAAACRPSARIVTTSSCSSTACRREPTRRRASSARLALALRLAAHRLVTDKAGRAPVLVLDDVLSELDPRRCEHCCVICRPGRSS